MKDVFLSDLDDLEEFENVNGVRFQVSNENQSTPREDEFLNTSDYTTSISEEGNKP